MWLFYLLLALAYIEAAGHAFATADVRRGSREIVVALLYVGLALVHLGIDGGSSPGSHVTVG